MPTRAWHVVTIPSPLVPSCLSSYTVLWSVKWVCVWVLLSCVRLFATPWTVPGILQARVLEWVACSFSRGSAQPRSPAWQADSSPAEPPGKPCQVCDSILSKKQGLILQRLKNAFLPAQPPRHTGSWTPNPLPWTRPVCTPTALNSRQ